MAANLYMDAVLIPRRSLSKAGFYWLIGFLVVLGLLIGGVSFAETNYGVFEKARAWVEKEWNKASQPGKSGSQLPGTTTTNPVKAIEPDSSTYALSAVRSAMRAFCSTRRMLTPAPVRLISVISAKTSATSRGDNPIDGSSMHSNLGRLINRMVRKD